MGRETALVRLPEDGIEQSKDNLQCLWKRLLEFKPKTCNLTVHEGGMFSLASNMWQSDRQGEYANSGGSVGIQAHLAADWSYGRLTPGRCFKYCSYSKGSWIWYSDVESVGRLCTCVVQCSNSSVNLRLLC